MRTVDLTTARKELSKLIEAGEPVAITRHGKVVAVLSPGGVAADFPHAGGWEAVQATHGSALEDVRAAQRRRDEILGRINSSSSRKRT